MRKGVLIILTVFLFYPAASFCQIVDDWLQEDTIPKKESTNNDSLGRMRYRVMKDISYGCQNPKPVIEDTDTIFLCIYFYVLPERVYDEVSVQLETDRMIIPLKYYSSEEEYPGVGIILTVNKFREIFNGIYDYRCIPASSYNGYYWQEYVTSYNIPDTYKNRIKTVSVTHPQTGGCDAPL